MSQEKPCRSPRRTSSRVCVISLLPGLLCALVAPAEAGTDRATIAVKDGWRLEVTASLTEIPQSDLPSGRSVWSFLETVEPSAILDRIDGAGLHTGEPGRFSMRGASWTQNAILLGGLDLTDPATGGVALIYPEMEALTQIRVTSALCSVELAAPGATLALVPREPGERWSGSAHLDWVPQGLQSRRAGPPAVARFGSSAELGAVAGGPVHGDRLRTLVAFRVTGVSRFEGRAPEELRARVASFLSHSVWQPTAKDRLRLVTAIQDVSRPFDGRARYSGDPAAERDTLVAAIAHWERLGGRTVWAAHAGFHTGIREPKVEGREADRPIDRLLDGAVPDLVFAAHSRQTTWEAGGRVAPNVRRLLGFWHAPRLGVSVGGASAADRPGAGGLTAEMVGGLPARVWDYDWAGPVSRRGSREIAAWVVDRLTADDRLVVEVGLRLDAAHAASARRGEAPPRSLTTVPSGDASSARQGEAPPRSLTTVPSGDASSARQGEAPPRSLTTVPSGDAWVQGAAQAIDWTGLSPRVSGRLRLTDTGRISLLGGYGQYQHRLLLDDVRFGDPAGPQGSVYRWNDVNGDRAFTPAERGALVARVGPGAADGSLASIDPALAAPRTREWVAGIEGRLPGGLVVGLTGFDRRERGLLAAVSIGVPLSAYTVRLIPDPAGDLAGPQDDQMLPVYDRKPETFGLDRYLLTSPDGHTGLHQGVELRVERPVGSRLWLLVGATGARTEIEGGSRGFRVTENDQGVIGDLHSSPNADEFAKGRGFFDRAYTIKVAAAWRAPGDVRVGAVARYQDGQPFGRAVVVPDLAQGPEAIPATPRGQIARGWALDESGRYIVSSGHRFTYTLTLDARLEKGLRLCGKRIALIGEVFNLLDTGHEVEENVVWGPRFREPTLVQPPRAFRLGAAIAF